MPGGQEPKAKKRKRGDRREKEKPLLAVQGLLRLDHCFVKPGNEEAEVLEVVAGEEKKKIVLAPDDLLKSEHDMVAYKAGYDTGPTNPLPQDEREEVIFAKQKVVTDAKEYFEEMKKETEEKREEREAAWAEAELSELEKKEKSEQRKAKREAKKAAELAASKEMPVVDPAAYGYAPDDDPDNPDNYQEPNSSREENVFGSFQPPAAETVELVEGELKPPGEEDSVVGDSVSVVHSEGNTRVVLHHTGEEGQEGEMGPGEMRPLGEEQEGSTDEQPEDIVNEDVVNMAMAVALEMEEKRRAEEWEKMELDNKKKEAQRLQVEADDLAREADRSELSLDELTTLRQLEAKLGVGYGQSQGPCIPVAAQGQRAVLDAYWEFVRENPQDFNGWAYLIQACETVDILDEIRTVYNAFLPLFPYCYAYWKRYSDIERKSENWSRALAILHRGLTAIPLSVDLWVTYLELYHKMYSTHEEFPVLFREQCEKAVATAGMEYRSDMLWELFIEKEMERKELRFVTDLFRRVVAMPTKLYNKHWDNFIAHVRDHHPRDILQYSDYEGLRKLTCRELSLTYRPDPIMCPELSRKVELPEDKLKAGMKERLVASLVATHEQTEHKVDDIYRFEEKLKRTYFHVKPLDQKQLRVWDQYLDWQVEQGDHQRIVVLFERCLIPCALYEQFWAKYARYLERAHKEGKDREDVGGTLHDMSDGDISKARDAFNTGLGVVDQLREARCTWTLRGWQETLEDGTQVMRAVVNEDVASGLENESEITKDKVKSSNKANAGMEIEEANLNVTPSIKECEMLTEADTVTETNKENIVVDGNVEDTQVEDGEVDKLGALKPGDGSSSEAVEAEMSGVVVSDVWQVQGRGWEAVRDVYRRAAIVHCPKKAVIRMKWAQFEENIGNVEQARDIMRQLVAKYPMLLEARMQQIDLERREKKWTVAEKMYTKLMKQIPSKHEKYKNMKTWIAMKYARFQFKICGNADKGLAALRSALKKERGNAKLYSQIIDICYQRQPIDVTGVTAAIELALVSKDLSNMAKLEFVQRKVEFMQEFGDVGRYRDAWDQLKKFRHLCSADLKVEARRKAELEEEEKRLQGLEEMRAQAKAEANMKAKIAESEGRLMCSKCQSEMLPNSEGVYEFENWRGGGAGGQGGQQAFTDIADQPVQLAEDTVIDLMNFDMDPEEEDKIKRSLEEKTKYKEVAPTWELNIERYGYGAKRKAYDPDYEHVESSKYREYERLEGEGYDETVTDPNDNRKKNLKAPGLGHMPGKFTPGDKKYTTSDYIIPPKVPQANLTAPLPMAKKPPGQLELEEHEQHAFDLPPELADPSASPCVNVPEWFVREGGELCLSESPNGMSVIRYWPKFLSEKGNDLMMTRLRRYCKWHQKQVKVGGEWKYQPRLVSWYGPCDYQYSGLAMEKNLNWAPELLDLLHRLISMTRHEFNSCFLNLYRHGYDMCGWHSDAHPQLGRNPPVASVSLGAVRVFELRKKHGAPNFIRFPLFPGSLLLMEGAVQEDWLHCLPKDPACKEERVNLTFRTMYAAGGGF